MLGSPHNRRLPTASDRVTLCGPNATGSDLRGLVAGHTYDVKLCMKTSRPGATPQTAWRHESQQVALNYRESALAPSGFLGFSREVA